METIIRFPLRPFSSRDMRNFCFAIFCLLLTKTSAASTWQDALLKADPAETARAARERGDAIRGAIVFHQATLACSRCHAVGGAERTLGPDLARIDAKTSDAQLVESVLFPSKAIREGYQTWQVETVGGEVLQGLLAEEKEGGIVLRDAAQDGATVTLRADQIATKQPSPLSLMPEGQIHQLASRQQFLDLLRYLLELRDGGPARAKEFQPPPEMYAFRLPEYENRIDHAGLISTWDEESFERGEAMYLRVCANCHGTHGKPGSLPTSLKFASDKFKNGSDPYAMYQTLTHGFGKMLPQTWMVPQQKYDVIHYIREAYLREHNSSQFVPADAAYLANLPKGDTFGPPPSRLRPWVAMDYGPSLINTYEVGNNATNFAYKGIAARLDAGPGGVSRGNAWQVFDHDTLRMAAGWTGEEFIDWNGIHFNGRHQVHPRVQGQVFFVQRTGPGWAHPESGTWEDPRLRGRDGRPYGPLPCGWAHLKGIYHHGARTIVRYTVGRAEVLESPGYTSLPGGPVFWRSINIGPRSRELVMLVGQHPFGASHWQTWQSGSQSELPVSLLKPEETNDEDHEEEIEYQDDPDDENDEENDDEEEDEESERETATTFWEGNLLAGVATENASGFRWQHDGESLRLTIPAGDEPLRFTIWLAPLAEDMPLEDRAAAIREHAPVEDLKQYTQGGPPRWTEEVTTNAIVGAEDGPFAVDILTPPDPNPWLAQTRLTGFDFYPDGDTAAVCAWDGDVWLVRGLGALLAQTSATATSTPVQLRWRRIASGLFQPLGLKIIDGQIFVTCRDQITILRDLNDDGETDFYENFNNDHQVTDHFHEFAMGAQIDAKGNYYYAKSARHALTALVPHHGTLLRVSPDGERTEILANGFRAANGVCLNQDGTFIVTDQEGHWNPKNRINWVREGGFYGNMFGYHDVTDSSDDAMEQPLCWITNDFDRSPAELLWVPRGAWGPLEGRLLNLSYGYGRAYIVPHEKIAGQVQGGMCALPLPRFPTGIMRGRFHPDDRQLYTCGMFAWGGDQQQPGGFYRIRYTGQPVFLPVELHARKTGMAVTFSGELALDAAENPENYTVRVWSLRRSRNYGSKHYNEQDLDITSATLSADRRTVSLEVPEIAPTWCMEIRYRLEGGGGEPFSGTIHNSIHVLGE